jgi:hypothetical protein
MKKQTKKTLAITFSIIGFILIILGVLYFTGTFQSVFNVYNIAQLTCSGNGDGTLSCSKNTRGNNIETASVIGITLNDNPSVAYINEVYISLKKQDSDVSDFFITATSGACDRQFWGSGLIYKIADQSQSTRWANSILNVQVLQSSPGYNTYGCGQTYWGINTNQLLSEHFNNQLMVIDFNIIYPGSNPGSQVLGTMKSYALCDLASRRCTFNMPETSKDVDLVAGGYKIYLKKDGYNLSNICVVDGIEACDGTSLKVCQGLSFTNKGPVDGKCGYVKPVITPPVVNPPVTPPSNNNTDTGNSGNTNNPATTPNYLLYVILGLIAIVILIVVIILVVGRK